MTRKRVIAILQPIPKGDGLRIRVRDIVGQHVTFEIESPGGYGSIRDPMEVGDYLEITTPFTSRNT